MRSDRRGDPLSTKWGGTTGLKCCTTNEVLGMPKTNKPAFSALRSLVPASQILYGADYPFMPMRSTAVGLTTLGIRIDEIQAIRRDNAAALFPRMKSQ